MKIVIIGQGGHSKVINDILISSNKYQLVGYLDDKYEEYSNTNNRITGPISAVQIIIEHEEDIHFVIGIGDNRTRKKIFEKLDLPLEFFVTLVHQSAVISPCAKIGYGTVVMPNAVINADACIGHHTIINTSSVIEHDNKIGHYVHVSPNSVLTGNVTVDDGVHIGASSSIIPGIHIYEWSIIGAGATVIKNIPAYCTAVGVPAKIISRNIPQKVGI